MGLTAKSTGKAAYLSCKLTEKQDENDIIVALAGNPNVGKSTVFNALTGLKQHTGNWPGKTVAGAKGHFNYKNKGCTLVDTPGCYSLMSRSAEETVTRDFICFGQPDAVIVVCDACCLQRNLILAMQIMQITSKVIICVNMLDEAKHKGVSIDFKKLEKALGVAVVGISARNKKGLEKLKKRIFELKEKSNLKLEYNAAVEEAINKIQPDIDDVFKHINTRWLSLKLLERDEIFIDSLKENYDFTDKQIDNINSTIKPAEEILAKNNITSQILTEITVTREVQSAHELTKDCVFYKKCNRSHNDVIDKILTGKTFAIPIMLVMVAVVFWITIIGANYPSKVISSFLLGLEQPIFSFLLKTGLNTFIVDCLVFGVYRVVAWIVSVMLPPMAIFFPIFTLLEDIGYLPRVAFNIDRCFKKSKTCGKQALTMCMGFGCNAAGVVGCRIIESKRERLIAIITNSFMPCNGRFPMLISIISMFFVVEASNASFLSAIYLTALILLSVFVTLLVSNILSVTLLKGEPSSFTLELPPYRKPQFFKVIIRSLLDRTVYVLGRALISAVPAGLIIWILANIDISGQSLLILISNFLDPFGKLLGLDGVIILAFILGLPANEIVVPIIIMAYTAKDSLISIDDLGVLKDLLVSNGWTAVTAICLLIFTLFHWPCSTTLLTIKKETQSLKWTTVSFILPMIIGIVLCFTINFISKII